MHRMFWFIALLLVLLAIALGVTFSISSQLPQKADAFFKAVAQKDLQKAYAMTSSAFQKQTPLEAFETRFGNPVWTTYRTFRWEERSASAETAPSVTVRGIVELGDTEGETAITFVYQDETWRIEDIALMDEEQFNRSIPTTDEATMILSSTMISFIEAVERNDFSTLYMNLAESWKAQTNPEQLRKSFDAFLRSNVDLSSVPEMLPELVGDPFIDANGMLQLTGQFQLVGQGRVLLQVQQRYQDNTWKISGLELKFVPLQ